MPGSMVLMEYPKQGIFSFFMYSLPLIYYKLYQFGFACLLIKTRHIFCHNGTMENIQSPLQCINILSILEAAQDQPPSKMRLFQNTGQP